MNNENRPFPKKGAVLKTLATREAAPLESGFNFRNGIHLFLVAVHRDNLHLVPYTFARQLLADL